MTTHNRPRVSVHKFSSCDGCQLALLNLGEDLLRLGRLLDIRHFAEAGVLDEDAEVDVAFVEGSISVPTDLGRIRRIRERSGFLVAIGACATSGGIQALRGLRDGDALAAAVYPRPEYIAVLATATPIDRHVKVDLQLGGCPVDSAQVLAAVRDLLAGVRPAAQCEPLCQECKRRGVSCVLVTRGEPCMGPVTRAGCGALCPAFGRACYACYGPPGQLNPAALAARFRTLGLPAEDAARRFRYLHSGVEAYSVAARAVLGEALAAASGETCRDR